MNKVFGCVLAFGLWGIALSPRAFAGSSDSGVIAQVYVDANGSIAIQLVGGFPNATSSGQCPTSLGWAGDLAPDPVLKAALLSAKATGETVQVSIYGCETNGTWWKLGAVYLE